MNESPYRKDAVEIESLRPTWSERWDKRFRNLNRPWSLTVCALNMLLAINTLLTITTMAALSRDQNLKRQLDTANETIRRQAELLPPPVKPLSLCDHPVLTESMTIVATHDVKAGEVLCPCIPNASTYCFVQPTDAGVCP